MNALATALPRRLMEWHEGRSAVRMSVAALSAYLLTAVIHLPGPYSALITTLVIARPHSGGVLRTTLERLLATILGAGIACVATFGRLAHIPEVWLIAITLSPLALVAAHNSGYRTAMIAAMIVLSAPASAGAPLHVAAVRMLGVSLGAAVGALVSVTQSLRELGMLIRDRHDAPPAQGLAAAMVKFTVQMHADTVFLRRELQANEALPAPVTAALERFACAFQDVTPKVAALARGGTVSVDFQELYEACRQASEALRESCPHSEGARLMLRRLIQDLGALTRSIERSQDGGHRHPIRWRRPVSKYPQ